MNRISIGVVLLSAALAGCPAGAPGMPGGGGGGGGTAGGELDGQCRGDFGSGAAAQKLETFLMATSTFVGTAAELEGQLTSTCREMGAELGIADSEMQASGNTPAVRAACDPVSAKIQTIMSDLRAQGGVQVNVVSTPPRCEVSMNAYAECAAECDAEVDPGQLEMQCEGGEIVGECSAECTGVCEVEVSGRCQGECHGTCSGGCQGVCQGACDGECSQRGPDGQCNGTCDGVCQGSCSAGCQGECNGECWVEGQANCEGECRGGCSVEYEEPRCTGEVRPPRVAAECEASCDAELSARAECEPGYTEVSVTGDFDSNIGERVEMLRAALGTGLGTVKQVEAKLRRLAESGRLMIATGRDLPGAVGSLGLQAGACVSQAASLLPRATASVSVSVEVSASMSASAGAG